jgi:ATP phosphoribosyltransferase regulatory subunit
MVVESLRTCGLREFQISVGHAQFLSGLIDAAGLSKEKVSEIRELLFNKNFFGVEECVAELSIPEELKKLFGLLGNFDTDIDLLGKVREYAQNYPVILEAAEQLTQLYDFMTIYGIEKYISFELGTISDYQYYTGIIFSGYTYGTGEPVVKGGRYDKLLSYYGKNTPAIGYAIQVDQLLAALSRQNIKVETPTNSALLVFNEKHAAEAIRKAKVMRAQGMNVQVMPFRKGKTLYDYSDYAFKNDVTHLELMNGE